MQLSRATPASRAALKRGRGMAVARPRVVAAPARPVVVARASSSGGDFDDFLNKMADKFEKSQNKPVVVGYGVAAVVALLTAEWLIHLPLLDFLLGFPIQLLGLLALPYLGLRYLADGGDVGKDVEDYTAAIVKKLPGLDK